MRGYRVIIAKNEDLRVKADYFYVEDRCTYFYVWEDDGETKRVKVAITSGCVVIDEGELEDESG